MSCHIVVGPPWNVDYPLSFCSDFIPNDKRAYGSKQFEVFGLHFEVFVKYLDKGRPGRESHYFKALDQGGPILGGFLS